MKLSFAARRRFISGFWRSHDRMNAAATWFFEEICHYQPRRHSALWFVAIWLFIDCAVCFFVRAFALGALAGFILARIL